MPFYSDIPDNISRLQQGDIIWPVPFVTISLKADSTVRRPDGTQIRGKLIDIEPFEGIGAITTSLRMGAGLVVTQTCDANDQKKPKPLLVSRVYECTQEEARQKAFTQTPVSVGNVKGCLCELSKVAKSPSKFGLRPFLMNGEELTYCVAHLLELQTFAPGSAELMRARVLARLGPEALQCLQERCAYCFSRFGADDEWLFCESDLIGIEAKILARQPQVKAATE